MIRRLLALMALLVAVVPAGADEFLMMDMPAGSPAVRSMLLWPPGLAAPSFSIDFLFDAQGPVSEPYRVRSSGTSGMRARSGTGGGHRVVPPRSGGVRRRVSRSPNPPDRWPAPRTRTA